MSTARAFMRLVRLNAGGGDGGVMLFRQVLRSLGQRIAVADARVLVECSGRAEDSAE